MACKPNCICKCDKSGCECWDGIGFAQLKREMDASINKDLGAVDINTLKEK